MVHVDEGDGDAGTHLMAPSTHGTGADEPRAAVDIREGSVRAYGDTGTASMAEGLRDILETWHGYLLLMMISASKPSRAIWREKSISMIVVRSITLWNARRL